MLERENGVYRNTADTDFFLDRAKPSYMGGMLEMCNVRLYGFWGSLTEALRTGEPQNEAKEGKDFFGALYAEPQRLREFLGAMAGGSVPQAVPGSANAEARSSEGKTRAGKCRHVVVEGLATRQAAGAGDGIGTKRFR